MVRVQFQNSQGIRWVCSLCAPELDEVQDGLKIRGDRISKWPSKPFELLHLTDLCFAMSKRL
jgi:hypothetical protein